MFYFTSVISNNKIHFILLLLSFCFLITDVVSENCGLSGQVLKAVRLQTTIHHRLGSNPIVQLLDSLLAEGRWFFQL